MLQRYKVLDKKNLTVSLVSWYVCMILEASTLHSRCKLLSQIEMENIEITTNN